MTQPPGGPPGWWRPPGVDQGPPRPAPHQPQGPAPNYGGSFQSQYGGLGAFGTPSPEQAPKRGKRKTLLVAGAITFVLGASGVTAWLLGAFRGDVLDQESLQHGVATVLRDSYGEHDVSNPVCPDDQPVRNGTTFECTVEVSGESKSVSIRVLNEKPEFEVGAPK
ncbi:protein of unknown function [Amycolatopsis marina]|uniref:DUF4333 domain-containing protein n=1 Tax=Amycolatopsis marina TaxID=490629 RepID=A0A1I1A512_9PSEU|nr:DUF4333 domain-containing protein [Amycolatopsis marina]SFB31503.1 protein of unknown function [Amycolatopsis marina]